jgi:hypothetical protein
MDPDILRFEIQNPDIRAQDYKLLEQSHRHFFYVKIIDFNFRVQKCMAFIGFHGQFAILSQELERYLAA